MPTAYYLRKPSRIRGLLRLYSRPLRLTNTHREECGLESRAVAGRATPHPYRRTGLLCVALSVTPQRSESIAANQEMCACGFLGVFGLRQPLVHVAPSLTAQDESALPEGLPNPLVFASGKPITSAKQWPSRIELLHLFTLQMYGQMLHRPAAIRFKMYLNETNPRSAARRLEPMLRFCSTETKTGVVSNCCSTRPLASDSLQVIV
jgi:hypothetical protein